jgi:hypothetical protein
MTAFFDLVRVYCTTTGTAAPLTLAGAVTFSGGNKAFRSFSDASVPDGAQISWAIEDLVGGGREAGTGTYSASAGTVTRNTTSSTNGNVALNLSGQAQLYITALAADITNASNFATGTLPTAQLPAGVLLTYSGSSDPTASNDTTQGYSAGALGINTTTGRAFACRSAAAAAAVWEPLGQSDHPGYVANGGNQWYPTHHDAFTAVGNSSNLNQINISAFIIKERLTISALGAHISTAASGGDLQLALYRDGIDSSNTHRPAALIDKTGSLSTTNAGFVSGALGSNQQLEPALYWVAWNADNSTVRINSTGSATTMQSYMIGSATGDNTVSPTALTTHLLVSQTFGTWPSTLAGSTFTESGASSGIIAAFKIASVP